MGEMLILGECLEKLGEIADNSIDSIVTDPPYGISFMGKKWDYDIPSVEIWKECLRVLKPGGHLLAFGGTRTYHRLVVNIEDAGFEIRDQIQWLYGSGFPKSMNVSKAIDKIYGAERTVVGVNPSSRPNSKKKNMRGFDNRDGAPEESAGVQEITASSTDDAKKWDGWGTALKPANEPICLARKPLSEKTVAENVIKWGTGAINIDGCRIEAKDQKAFEKNWDRNQSENNKHGKICREGGDLKPIDLRDRTPEGRWPANLILDEEAAELLDEQSGNLKAGGQKANSGKNKNNGNINFGGNYISEATSYAGQEGGASRFFYVAKASRSERNTGLEGMPEISAPKNGAEKRITVGGSKEVALPRSNHHPTVKPIKLMYYLCKLITPPSGIVLDPFMGSGSTGVAAVKEGFYFFGIELNEEYFEIASKRIKSAIN
jgi:DNA modification methylase